MSYKSAELSLKFHRFVFPVLEILPGAGCPCCLCAVILNSDSEVGCLSWLAAAVVNESAAGGELGSGTRVVQREQAQGEGELS